jgi:predicted dehydrogenase
VTTTDTGKPLTATVIGTGAGGRLSMAALIASPRFEVIGVTDISADARDRVEQDFPGVPTFADHTQMFANAPADVVCVSTYAPTHLALAEAAVAAGARGLLVEKPLGDTTEAGSRIVAMMRDRGLPMVVPHGLMALPGPRRLIDDVHAGVIGTLRTVTMECTGWDIVNAGIHWIQFFVALVDPDPVVFVLTGADTSTQTFRDGMQVETSAVTLARTATGVRLVLETGDHVPVARDDTACLMRFVGDDGHVEYAAWDNAYTLVGSDGRVVVDGKAGTVTGHRHHLEHLADLIDTGTLDWSVPDTSLRALEIVESAYLSARTGAAVSLPLSSFVTPAPIPWDPGVPYAGVGGGRNGREL